MHKFADYLPQVFCQCCIQIFTGNIEGGKVSLREIIFFLNYVQYRVYCVPISEYKIFFFSFSCTKHYILTMYKMPWIIVKKTLKRSISRIL